MYYTMICSYWYFTEQVYVHSSINLATLNFSVFLEIFPHNQAYMSSTGRKPVLKKCVASNSTYQPKHLGSPIRATSCPQKGFMEHRLYTEEIWMVNFILNRNTDWSISVYLSSWSTELIWNQPQTLEMK